jgi:alkanesulfonate monooxygenase SsuD/methylene tetrahydromethanopterin reductase-like flavin-dependent oxidoreductase (luciferase family)
MSAKHPLQFGMFVPQITSDYASMLALAQKAESLGFDSFWLMDHLYGPWLPDVPSLEGWTLATALLAQTRKLRVGHLVMCATFRHPALLGKMATSLDVISGGRLELGLGSGSVEQEHHEMGIPWGKLSERTEKLAETLEIVSSMFEKPRTASQGRNWQVRDIPNLPKPVQKPRPPLVVGGMSVKHTLPLVARYADVWNVPTYGLPILAERDAALSAECEKIGRDPATIRKSLQSITAIGYDDKGVEAARAAMKKRFGDAPGFGLDSAFIGTPASLVDRIGKLTETGFSSFMFYSAVKTADATMDALAKDVLPQLQQR